MRMNPLNSNPHHWSCITSYLVQSLTWPLTDSHMVSTFLNTGVLLLLFSSSVLHVCYSLLGLQLRYICFNYCCQVVSYDFKKERFAHLHRLAIGFPEVSFSYIGTLAAPGSQEAAEKGEAYVRAQFQEDPYGCLGSLHRKRLKRDPFHRIIPYPSGCPELKGLFSYCGSVPYPGELPWSQ